MPEPLRKDAHQLLDHQCWVLGKDVLSAEGNMLCEFGFTPRRCPQGGLTQYELENALGEGSHVFLWGFGAFFGSEGEGIFLGRKDFKPFRTVGRVEMHSKDAPAFTDESCRPDLLSQGLNWLASYEDWIASRMPQPYQEQCLAEFPRRALPRKEFAPRWRLIASSIGQIQ